MGGLAFVGAGAFVSIGSPMLSTASTIQEGGIVRLLAVRTSRLTD